MSFVTHTTSTPALTHICIYVQTYAPACMDTHAHAHTHTHTYMHKHTSVFTWTYTDTPCSCEVLKLLFLLTQRTQVVRKTQQ